MILCLVLFLFVKFVWFVHFIVNFVNFFEISSFWRRNHIIVIDKNSFVSTGILYGDLDKEMFLFLFVVWDWHIIIFGQLTYYFLSDEKCLSLYVYYTVSNTTIKQWIVEWVLTKRLKLKNGHQRVTVNPKDYVNSNNCLHSYDNRYM